MSTSKDPIDGLIDETARELTEASHTPALRERVRARLRPHPRWAVPLWQPALAVAAMLFIAVVLPSRRTGVDAPTPIREFPAVVERVDEPAPAPPAGEQDRPSVLVASAGARPRAVPLPADTFAPLDGALEPVEPLAIHPLPSAEADMELLSTPAPLGIATLEIERLALE